MEREERELRVQGSGFRVQEKRKMGAGAAEWVKARHWTLPLLRSSGGVRTARLNLPKSENLAAAPSNSWYVWDGRLFGEYLNIFNVYCRGTVLPKSTTGRWVALLWDIAEMKKEVIPAFS